MNFLIYLISGVSTSLFSCNLWKPCTCSRLYLRFFLLIQNVHLSLFIVCCCNKTPGMGTLVKNSFRGLQISHQCVSKLNSPVRAACFVGEKLCVLMWKKTKVQQRLMLCKGSITRALTPFMKVGPLSLTTS